MKIEADHGTDITEHPHDDKPSIGVFVFTRDSICYSAYMPSPVRLSVRP